MAISGNTSFTQTEAQLIADVLTSLGVIRPGGTVSTNDFNFCSNKLNKLVKSWEAQGIHMWKLTEGTVFLRPGINTYALGGTSTDNAGDNDVETVLTATTSSSSLQVTSTLGMTAADNIGIELDNGTRQWTTILSVDSSTALTLSVSLTSQASSGRTVFSYTTSLSKPLHITGCRFRNSDGTDRPCFIKGREEFMQIPNKSDSGKINQIHYSPNINDTTLYVWPTPDICADRLKISYVKLIDDFSTSTDNADFPTEWLYCLDVNLQYCVAKAYGKDAKDRQLLQAEAQQALAQMQLWDSDDGAVRVVPNYDDEQ